MGGAFQSPSVGDVAPAYPPGPVHDVVDRILSSLDVYGRHRVGAVTQQAFASEVLAHEQDLVSRGLAAADVHFATRLPPDPGACARSIIEDLGAAGVLEGGPTDTSLLAHAEEVARRMDHGGHSTYIYPEEAQALHLITASARPRRIVFCGSYYGYWAMWAVAAVGWECEVALIDPDPVVSGVAEQNLKAFGYDGFTRVIVGDAVEELPRLGPVDLVVIDAETPDSEPDPRRRGKGIYTALLSAAVESIAPGALVVLHNVVREHFNDDPFFSALIRRYDEEYGAMFETAEAELAAFRVYPTTEGLAVGRSRE